MAVTGPDLVDCPDFPGVGGVPAILYVMAAGIGIAVAF
jgi:hypothetical protein